MNGRIKSIMCFILVMTSIKPIFGQSPINDQTWQIDPNLSDDFQGNSLDLSKWQALDCPTMSPNEFINWGGNSGWSNQNVIINNACSLKVENNLFCQGYRTGGIRSNGSNNGYNYQYGYLEIEAKLPGYIDNNGIGHGDKLWPAFWAYYQYTNGIGPNGGPCIVTHDEIDIIDQCCNIYQDTKTFGSGWNDEDGNCAFNSNWKETKVSSLLCNNFHKYGVEWNTNKIIFYFDDNVIKEDYNLIGLSMLPLRLIIGCQLSAGVPFDPNSVFPQYMIINYFHFYKLNKDCNTISNILNNSDLSNYVFKVRKEINFGNGINSYVSFINGDIKYFRATNSITLSGELIIPLGAEVAFLPTDCN